jgi:hypothetical protein
MTETKKAKEQAAKHRTDLAFYACGGVPSAAELAVCPSLNSWHVVISRLFDVNQLGIKGRIYRHGAIPDGTAFTTRAVLWFDRKQRFVRCASGLFALGLQVGQQEVERDIPLDGVDR